MTGTCPFVSRGGLKLAHALDAFGLDVEGLTCADLGCNVGGFTDCLLQRGALRVHAVDTGYGALAWKLRQDARVVVHERTNALHLDPPEVVDLVVIDLGWTPMRHALPTAKRWLREHGTIVAIVKPHYELDDGERRAHLVRGVLDETIARRVFERVRSSVPAMGLEVIADVESPVRGGKSGRNVEWLIRVGGGG